MNIEKNQKDKDSDFKNFNASKIEENSVFTDGVSRDEIFDDIVIGLFSLKGRANRLEFFKIEIMIFAFIVINSFYFIPAATKEYAIGVLIVSWIMTLATIPITVRRLHDSNLGGEYYFISLIPVFVAFLGEFILSKIYFFLQVISVGFGIYFLYLVLRQGDPNANNYGIPNPPKKYGDKTINLISILIFIATVVGGIIATR